MVTKTIYITKYALTKGIIKAEAVISDSFPEIADVEGYAKCFYKNEWFYRKHDAVVNANKRKHRKILSLIRQMRKLENLEFKSEE